MSALLLLLVLVALCICPQPTLSVNQEGLYLIQAKSALSDPTDALSSWHTDGDPCSAVWAGVFCDPSTRRVDSLDLPSRQLGGPLPAASLCRLPSLARLSLANNSINSTLSAADLAACLGLRHLNLSQNLLVGPIPEALFLLPDLRELDLSGNNFSGAIPPSFGRFRSLESLVLYDNLLGGHIPGSLGNISCLRELSLAYNPFAPSPIPSQLGNLTSLENLWLAGCNLVGPIPASLGGMRSLRNLDLSTNRLSGEIPSSITGLKSIVQIELYNNSLSGELPVGMSSLTTLLRFDASMNQLTGTLPGELCELPLESLNLFDNRLEGTLPESIARSPNLYELKLFNNKLGGELPRQLGKNSALQMIDLSYNTFGGQIPESLCEKGALENLILIYNSFSGSIPASLGNCRSLSRVRLKHNKLSGKVPEKFWGLPRVYLLDLADNSLSGSISSKLSGAYNMSTLLIAKNSFSGPIPDTFGSLGNLVEFSANDNELSGEIPASLVKLSQLGKLDLSHNQISREIPVEIKECKKLNELNLAGNKLSGDIPREIGSLSGLNYIDLSGNLLSGEIPIELENLKLNLLNLSNNHLSGNLPPFYANENYKTSFMGNPGLCRDHQDLCSRMAGNKDQKYLWILRAIFIIAAAMFVFGIVIFLKCQTFKKNKNGITISRWQSFHKLAFSELDVVQRLNEDNVIGVGASGKVYKVVIKGGEEVAVKKLWRGANKEDEEQEKDEFEAEVEMLGKIRHKNIVRLLCCCSSGDCKLLVYEYMPNGSLGDMLHSTKGVMLDWPTRYKIAVDSAEALSYLHHDCVPPIVHRDVKSNNILLDASFGAKVADFGVAKVVGGLRKSMSVIAGSCGYIAPEYGYTLRVNEKSDIYSFGVVILELVTRKLPVDPEFGEKDLVKWVFTTVEEKGLENVIDPKLDCLHKEEVGRVLNIGLLCANSLPINRPSMRRVVNMLQEASLAFSDNNSKSCCKDGKLSPYYYYEDASDQATTV